MALHPPPNDYRGQFKRREASWTVVLTWTLITAAVTFVIDALPFVHRSLSQLENLFWHELRSRAGHAPALSPKLKILAYDDTSFASFDSAEIRTMHYAKLLKSFERNQPQAVVIDALFGAFGALENDGTEALNMIASVSYDIFSGSFALSGAINDRAAINLEQPFYQLKTYLKSGANLASAHFGANITEHHVYGPGVYAQHAFHKLGNIQFVAPGKVLPVMRTDEGHVIFNLGMLAAKSLVLDDGRLFANGSEVPTDRFGETYINYPKREALLSSFKRLSPFINRSLLGLPITSIEPGDVVLLLSNVFTGGGDMKDSPISGIPLDFWFTTSPGTESRKKGLIPGGANVAAVINGVMTGQWIRVWDSYWATALVLVVVAFCGAALAAAETIPANWRFALMGALLALIPSLSATLFVFADLKTPVIPFVFAAGWAFRNVNRERVVRSSFKNRLGHVALLQSEFLRKTADAAQTLSSSLAAPALPHWPGFSVQSYTMGYDIGNGDWHSFVESGDGRFFHILIIDSTGHGLGALFTSLLCNVVLKDIRAEQAELLNRADFTIEFAKQINHKLCFYGAAYEEPGRVQMYTVSFLGLTLERGTGTLRYLKAGQIGQPVIFNRKRIAANGMPELTAVGAASGRMPSLLGLGELPRDLPISQGIYALQPGDEVLLYTDGCCFGLDRRVLRKVAPGVLRDMACDVSSTMKLHQFHEECLNRLSTLANGRNFSEEDDLTLIWLRYEDEASDLSRDKSA